MLHCTTCPVSRQEAEIPLFRETGSFHSVAEDGMEEWNIL